MASKARVASQRLFDIAIVGAGPVGLAAALALGRRGLQIAIIDKRPPPHEDRSLRPQLLVARRADLGNLARLDVVDSRLLRTLSSLDERVIYDPFSVTTHVTKVASTAFDERDATWGDRRGIEKLLAQPPAALLPIGSLQLALYEALVRLEQVTVTCLYGVNATRLRRHAQHVSVTLDGAKPLRARLVIVATGTRRQLLDDVGLVFDDDADARRRIVAGLYARDSDVVRWSRTERAWRPHPAVRTMLLEARRLTALLCQMPPGVALHREGGVFRGVAAQLGLPQDPDLGPLGFDVRVGAVKNPVRAGDGRAPVIALGDAALTGHVFSGSVGFVNLALALELADAITGRAGKGRIDAQHVRTLARYVRRFEKVTTALHAAADVHLAHYAPGQWCLLGQPRRTGAVPAAPRSTRRGSQ